METLSTDTKKLLDKLYNLRSEDSVILTGIEDGKKEAEETLEKTSIKKEELQNKIAILTNEEELIQEQSSKLLEVLAGINENDFSLILEKSKSSSTIHESLAASLTIVFRPFFIVAESFSTSHICIVSAQPFIAVRGVRNS